MRRSLAVAAACAALALAAAGTARASDIITGMDSGAPGGHVKRFDGLTQANDLSFFAYPGFTGGVRVGAGDVNGDGRADIITGAGPGAPGGHVKVFDGQTQAERASFFAYMGFTGGIFVASGDVNRDGLADIITGADSGGGSHVKVFSAGSPMEIASFFAYGIGVTGGVRVGAGDVNGDGWADIITGAGPGAPGGHVKVFDGRTGAEIRSFLASATGFNGGVYVAGGDVNRDGFADIIVGLGSGGPPQVQVFNGVNQSLMASFFAYNAGFTGGVRVGAADVNGDGFADIITGTGAGAPGGHVKVFSADTPVSPTGEGSPIASFFAYPGFSGGVFVAGASAPTAIPEPGSALLMSLGILAAAVRLRRRRRAAL